MAENSVAKMAVKPVVTSDIVKQQKELEEQRRKIKEQQEEVYIWFSAYVLRLLSAYLFFYATSIGSES